MSLMEAIAEQHDRRSRLDPRLPALDRSCLSDLLSRTEAHTPGLARLVEVKHVVTALAWPAVEHYPPDSDKLAYYEGDTGTAVALTIRDGSEDSRQALSRLLDRIEQDWRVGGATGANILWPCRDVDIDALLTGCGFMRDACIAYRPAPPSALRAGYLPVVGESGLVARTAVPDDEPTLLRLQEVVLEAHIPASPFARFVPGVRSQFRKRLGAMWAGQSPDDGGCLVTVVEKQGRVVGMSECFVKRHTASLDMLLPEGRYGYVNTFGILPEWRGDGTGRFLAGAVDHHLRSLQVRGNYLYYSYYNRGAVAFWSKLGYAPLWRTYQRRDLAPRVA